MGQTQATARRPPAAPSGQQRPRGASNAAAAPTGAANWADGETNPGAEMLSTPGSLMSNAPSVSVLQQAAATATQPQQPRVGGMARLHNLAATAPHIAATGPNLAANVPSVQGSAFGVPPLPQFGRPAELTTMDDSSLYSLDGHITPPLAGDARRGAPSDTTGPPAEWKAAVARAFMRMRDPDSTARRRAVRELRRLVEATAAELGPEQVRGYQRVVNSHLAMLSQRMDYVSRIGSVDVVAALVDVAYSDGTSRAQHLSFFHSFLSRLLGSPEPSEPAALDEHRTLCEACAKTIGAVLRNDPSLRQEVVEAEVKRCLEWMQGHGPRSYAAAVSIRELARAAPELALPWLPKLSEALSAALMHPDKAVRGAAAAAAAALFRVEAHRALKQGAAGPLPGEAPLSPAAPQSAAAGGQRTLPSEPPKEQSGGSFDNFVVHCLSVLKDRHRQTSGPPSRRSNDSAKGGEEVDEADPGRSVAASHGALLALKELASTLRKDGSRLTSVRQISLALCRDTAEPCEVRLAAADALASCAQRSPFNFAPVLEEAIHAICACAQHGEELIPSYGSTTWSAVSRTSPDRVPVSQHEVAWKCVATIVEACSQDMCSAAALRDVLPDLREQVVQALDTVCCAGAASAGRALLLALPGDPGGTAAIAAALLRAAEHLPFGPALTVPLTAVAQRERSSLQTVQQLVLRRAETELEPGAEEKGILVALDALTEFDFQGRDLSDFCESRIVGLLDHSATAVRRQAAKACCALLQTSVAYLPEASPEVRRRVVLEVLRVAVADPDGNTRVAALRQVSQPALATLVGAGPSGVQGIPLGLPSHGSTRMAHLPPSLSSDGVIGTPKHGGPLWRGGLHWHADDNQRAATGTMPPSIGTAHPSPGLEPVVENSSFLNSSPAGAAFAQHLVCDEALTALAAALSDEMTDVREVALDALAGLSSRAPAAGPLLDRLVRHVISELECPIDSFQQEAAARMLARMARVSPRHLAAYGAPTTFTLLVRRLKAATTARLRCAFLTTLTTMFEAGLSERWHEHPALMQLTDLTAGLVSEPSGQVTAPAARVLAHCIRYRGQVGTLLRDHPGLLSRVLGCFREEDRPRRIECMRLLGVIGAVDPWSVRRLSKAGGGKPVPLPKATASDYDAHQAVHSLMEMLEHPPMAFHRRVALQALQQVLRGLPSSQDTRAAAIVARAVPALVRLLCHLQQQPADAREAAREPKRDSGLLDGLLRCLIHAIALAPRSGAGVPQVRGSSRAGAVHDAVDETLIRHCPEIAAIMTDVWDSGEQQEKQTVIELAVALEAALGKVHVEGPLRWLAPRLVEAARRGHTDQVLAVRAVQSFELLTCISVPFLSPVVTCLTDVAGATDMPSDLRVQCLRTLAALGRAKLPLRDVASRVVHSLVRIAQGVVTPPQDARHQAGSEALQALLECAKVMDSEFNNYRHLVQRSLSSIDSDAARDCALKLAGGTTGLGPELSPTYGGSRNRGWISPAAVPSAGGRTPVNDAASEKEMKEAMSKKGREAGVTLEKIWQAHSQARTTADYERWFDQLAQALLQHSPRSVLRACAEVGRSTPLLARRLFATSFALCYNSLSQAQQKEIAEAVQAVLVQDTVPRGVLRPLLNLATFVERTYAQHFADTGQQQRAVYKFLPASRLCSRAGACQNYGQELIWLESEISRIDAEVHRLPGPAAWPTDTRARYLQMCKRLMHVNRCLELPSQAEGVLRVVQQRGLTEGETGPETYEEIGWWEKAYDLHYNCLKESQAEGVENIPALTGMLRCREHLGHWDQVSSLANHYWKTGSEALKKRTARAVSHASWMLEDWDGLQRSVQYMPQPGTDRARHPGDSPPGCTAALYRAMIEIHRENYGGAQQLINDCRQALEQEVTAHVGDALTPDRGLSHSYELVVMLQHLAEAEEVIDYLQINALLRDERRLQQKEAEFGSAFSREECTRRLGALRRVWSERLRTMRHDPWHLRDTLELRTLCVPPHDCLSDWLHFVDCLGNPRRALKTLRALLGRGDAVPHTLAPQYMHEQARKSGWRRMEEGARGAEQVIGDAEADPELILTLLQRTWEADPAGRPQLLMLLQQFAERLGLDAASQAMTRQVKSRKGWANTDEHNQFASGVLVTFARWQRELAPHAYYMLPHRKAIDQNLTMATRFLKDGHGAWHDLALLHLKVALRDQDLSPQEQGRYAVRACDEFVRSIRLSEPPEMAQQDMLRLLRLCVTFGHIAGRDFNVERSVRAAFDEVPARLKAAVLPQIVARIDEAPPVRGVIRDLLTGVAKHYPQRVLLALSVALSDTSANPDHDAAELGIELEPAELEDRAVARRRYEAARIVRDAIHRQSPELTRQVETVTGALVRLALPWPERWHEALLEASRPMSQSDGESVARILLPLHRDTENPQCEDDRQFVQWYGRDLAHAREHLRQWQTTRRHGDMKQAWLLYCQVYRNIESKFGERRATQLAHVAPELTQTTGLLVAVPGVLQDRATDDELLLIARFVHTLPVIGSKRRPRQLSLFGTDGKKYMYLLKGHEDLRLDQRVMQLLDLTNTLLRHDRRAMAKSEETWSSPLPKLPQIVTYAVVPLSPTAGLLGWVEDAQTLDALVYEMRGGKGKRVREESDRFLQYCYGHDRTLLVIQRVEALENTLADFNGDDVSVALWLRASTTAEWVDSRARYVRSLSIMSMIGYVLGLGDRHPGNLMLRADGTVAHIDFGDCFEVAQQRETHPERVPFRLTRMLVRAMGAGGAEGVFRRTAQLAMGILRREQSSVMAMLEAFVHDPLITWRLIGTTKAGAQEEDTRQEQDREAAEPPPPMLHVAAAATLGERPAASCIVSLRQLYHPDTRAATGKAQAIVRRVQDKLDGMDFPEVGGLRGAAGPGCTGSPQPDSPQQSPTLTQSGLFPSFGGRWLTLLAQTTTSSPRETPCRTPGASSLRWLRLVTAGRFASDTGLIGISPGGRSPLRGAGSDASARQNGCTPRSDGSLRLAHAALEVAQQVDHLIREAQSIENLAQCYPGWCPFW
eukprot:TRINITY_DN3839_c1_g1_i2.p1 TRINITY_DN3839_c1_g1~~TRINITY_DN3839_c1_g1_i2.p1  ORF type:complete len:3014 (+),score=931.13 TRINITY_DN3839_c1_g1_i2:140-9181(+)